MPSRSTPLTKENAYRSAYVPRGDCSSQRQRMKLTVPGYCTHALHPLAVSSLAAPDGGARLQTPLQTCLFVDRSGPSPTLLHRVEGHHDEWDALG